MKKSLNSALLRFLMMGGVLVSIVFTACENFLDGAVLKKTVEKEIEWEKAESLSVLVTPEEGTGSTVPFGNYDCKLGYFFEVSFTENNSYSFIKWAAVSADNLSEEIEGVLFEDASSPKTTVKFARPISNVRILPVCTQRIAVSGEPSPRYEPNGVARDRSISVTFTKELSEENFIFQPEELPQGAAAQTDDDGKIWAYVSGNQTFLKNISITNADDFSIAEHFSRPQVNGRLLTIPVDKTKPIQFNSGEVFKTIKVTLSKEISDSDNIKMNYSKSWNYLITEATDEKATVNLSGNSSEGSVYLAGTKDYSLGQKITLAFTENTDWQFIKWDYDSSVIYIDNPESINTTAVVIEKTTEDNPTQIRAVCARRLRLAENGYEPKTSGNETVSKNSSIQLTFDQKVPADAEDLAQLANLSITVGGTPVRTCFNAPVISGNTVSFTANKSNMLDVTEGQTKTVTVTIPADFYYKLDDGTKVTWGGNGFAFDYRIDSTTTQKASVVFEMETDSGTITPVTGLHEYSEGQEVAVSFVPADGWEFRGWTVKTGAGDDVPASKIKILDPDALSTKLIVYDALSDVKVRADAVLLPAVSSFTPAYESGGKDCDTPVVIIFNKAMKTGTFNLYSEADAQGMKGTIQIVNPSNEYEHYEEYFNAPSWSADGKTLTLKPKNTIRDALVKNDSDLRNIRIVLDISKVTDTDGNRLKEADASWVYRINHSMETIAPTVTMKMYKRGFNIQEDSTGEYTAVENNTYTKLSISQFSSFTPDDFSDNHVGAKIYFDATVSDEGSGYKQLTINETLIRMVDTTEVEQKCVPKILLDDSFTKKEYELQSQYDGVVQLDFVFEDYAGSKATRTWYVIKDTTIETSVFSTPNPTMTVGTGNAYLADDSKYNSSTSDFYDIAYYSGFQQNVERRFVDEDGKVKEDFDFSSDYYSTDTYYKGKYSKREYIIVWGYSEDELTNLATKVSNNNKFYFNRIASEYCFIKMICSDDVGNVKNILRVIPKQSSIISGTTQPNQIEFAINSKKEWTAIAAKYNVRCAGEPYILYTYQEDEAHAPSYFRSSTQSDTRSSFPITNNPYIATNRYRPAGIYKIYVLYRFITNENSYMSPISEPYTVSISYDTNNTQIITEINGEDSQEPPDFPTSFTCKIKDIVPGLETRDVSVVFPDNFTTSSGFKYGTKYVNSSGKTYYSDLDFTVDSLFVYTVYLYAKNIISGSIYYSSLDPCTVDARADNVAPVITASLNETSAPNKIRLKELNLPKDRGDGLYENNEGLVEFKYYILKSNIEKNSAAEYKKEQLLNVPYQKAVYNKTRTTLDLPLNTFTEGYYTVVYDLIDKYNNEKLYSTVLCTITTPLIPQIIYPESEDPYFSTLKEDKNGISKTNVGHYYYLTENDIWENGFFGEVNSNNKYIFTLTNFSQKTGTFVETYYSLRNMANTGAGFSTSLNTYLCPDYELKSASEKAACCKSKSVIPGLGGAYQVYYDAPCFAHTMAFPTDMLGDLDSKLAEAKSIDSTVDDETYIKAIWETKGREYGLKLINSAWLDSASTATYTAPVSEIPAGYSYVTIFHFADGTSVMSEVKQK